MLDEFIIKTFLLSNKAEVKGMFLTEYDQEKVLELVVYDDRRRVAADMLKNNLPLSLIEEISKLSEEAILKIAKNLGIAVV